jgi:hypothetical protein
VSRLSTALAMTEAAYLWRPGGGVASEAHREKGPERGCPGPVVTLTYFLYLLVVNLKLKG